MAITKIQKQKILEDLKDKVAKQKVMVLVGITGLKVKDLSELRKSIKAIDGNLKVAKKTLIEKTLKENNLDFEGAKYKEKMALVFGFADEITSAKIVHKFSLSNKNIKILGGFSEGRFIAAEEMIALAQLPGREELIAKLIGSIQAPIANLLHALNYNIKGLLQVLAKAKA